MGRAPGGRLLPPGVPLPRRAGHPRGRRPLRRPPGRHRLSGRQRARDAALPQPGVIPALRRPAQGAVRRRRDPEPGVGAHVLVAPAERLVGPVDARTATRSLSTTSRGAATRPTSPPSSSPGRPASSREYARPGQFVTTCIAYPRPAIDDEALVAALDVDRGQPVLRDAGPPRSSRSRSTASRPGRPPECAGLFRQADRLFSSNQSRFLVTETDAQSIGGPEFNLPPYPGQLRQAAFALISRGAAMIEYWHWHTLPYGTETYWGGVLPHSLVPGRVYEELVGGRRRARRHRRPAGRVRARCGRRDPLVDRQPVRAGVQSALPRRRRHARSRVLPADLRRVPPRRHRRGRAGADPAHRPGSRARSRRARGAVPGARRARRSTSRRMPTSICCATTPRPAGTW